MGSTDETPAAGTKLLSGAIGGPGISELLVGSVLGRYQLERAIGEGGMGWVFLARHLDINKHFALKLLRPALGKVPESVGRFEREARAASEIDNQHIASVTDFGTTAEGAVYFVMEHVPGRDLSEVVKRGGPMPWRRVRGIVLQLCEALGAAHEKGIVHRDLKPENVRLLDTDEGTDFVKVLDFGIARLVDGGDPIVTKTGVVMGTPGVMPPEQAAGQHVDLTADVYALAASAYWMMTGKAPFAAKTAYGVLQRQMTEDPRPPSQQRPGADIPGFIDAALIKALARDPAKRHRSMDELAHALNDTPVDEPRRSENGARQIGVAVAVVLVLALLAWALVAA